MNFADPLVDQHPFYRSDVLPLGKHFVLTERSGKVMTTEILVLLLSIVVHIAMQYRNERRSELMHRRHMREFDELIKKAVMSHHDSLPAATLHDQETDL